MLTGGGAAAVGPAGASLRAVDVARGIVTPGDEKLDSRLRALVVPARAPVHRRELVIQPPAALRGSKVHVFVRVESAAAEDLAALARAGLRVGRVNVEHGLVRGWVRTRDLRRLAGLALVRSVEPVRPAHLRAGSVTGEGDAAARAPEARATGFDGTGITVGVISDGIDRVGASIVSGDVPAATGVPPGSGCARGRGDEGTAMLETVHDLAPGATLLFSEGDSDKLAFIDSLTCLRNAGAQVIVDDLGFFDEPFFEDGMVAEAVRSVVQAGVSYHTAAGNGADVHYGAPFAATTDASSGAVYHAFAGGSAPDTFDRMDVPPRGVLECVLQWNDPWGASSNDYDLELWDMDLSPPALIEASTNVQSGTQNPFEGLAAVQNAGTHTGHVGVRIRRVSGVDRQLGLFCPGAANLQYGTPAGSIFGHAALTEVVTVGAVDIHDEALHRVESFSSQGPVTIYFPGFAVRDKPDLVGFDGVATSVCPSAALCFAPFFGTSAAAPHSAAVAALLMSKNSCLTPAEIQQQLAQNADDLLPLGVDDVSGAGRLDALNVLDAPWACDDGNACTRDTCTPATGCQHAVRPDGSSCDDGNLCNGIETCASSTCVPGTSLVCDDGNPCTTNFCVPATGCVSTDACNDHDPCTADTCDPMTGCQHAAVADGAPCTDTDLCNGTETCAAGICTPGAPLVCDGAPTCSGNDCDARLGCTYPPIEGFPGLACLCGEGLVPAACGSTAAPRGVAARFTRACARVTRAAGLRKRGRAIRVLNQAMGLLREARKSAVRSVMREGLPVDCATALTGILDDARNRALLLSGTL